MRFAHNYDAAFAALLKALDITGVPRLTTNLAAHTIGLLAAIALAIGCSRDRVVGSDHATVETPTVADDPDGCDMVRINMHPDAEALIAEFVRRDARGDFRESNEWFNGAVDCPGHEPGPDQAAVVSSYTLRTFTRQRDSVRSEVRWVRLGYVTGGVGRVAPGVDVGTLTAVRTSFGWRISSPAMSSHMPPPIPKAK